MRRNITPLLAAKSAKWLEEVCEVAAGGLRRDRRVAS